MCAILYPLPFLQKARFIIQVSCVHIQNLMSGHEAVFIGSALYALDVYHFANSSTQQSACTVEPGTANDVGKIVSD